MKKGAFTLLLLFGIIASFTLVNAAERQPYLFDPVIPEKGELELKGELNVDLFSGQAHAPSRVVYY